MRGQAAAEILALGARQDVLGPIVIGIIQGSVYGLVGLGLVLLYKSNRIFNFAQGEFGTVAGLITFNFVSGTRGFPKVPYPLAACFGLLAAVLVALLVERLVIRPLFRQPKVTLLVATAGAALFLIGAELLTFGAIAEFLPPVRKDVAFSVFGGRNDPLAVQVTYQQFTIVLVLLALAVAAAAFFRTRYGIAILAVSQEPTAASIVGISVSQVSALTWGIAGLLGGAAGILFAGLPTTNFAPGYMTTSILIPGFTAAVLGGITSLPGAFLGGIALGVVEQVVNANATFPGASSVAVALTLLVVLLVRPAGLIGKEA